MGGDSGGCVRGQVMMFGRETEGETTGRELEWAVGRELSRNRQMCFFFERTPNWKGVGDRICFSSNGITNWMGVGRS